MKMNPPLRTEADRQALIEGLRVGDDRLHRHRPRAARARREGGPVRAGADGHDRAGDRVRRALHRAGRCPGVLPLELVVERLTDGAALFGLPMPRIAPGEPANLCLVDLERRLGRRRGRLREPLGELLLRRPRRCAAGCC